MSEPHIFDISRIEAVFEQRDWGFATDRAADIAAHWKRLSNAYPDYFDGRVLVQYQRRVEDDVFHARYLETSYSAFIAWRDFGWPDMTVRNGFPMAALRGADGAFLLGEMGAHTANAGKVYFPAGTPEPSDVRADGRVDLLGGMLRELEEETGLTAAEVTVGAGWTAVSLGPRIAFMRKVSLAMDAEAGRELILSRLAKQAHPELADIRIVRSPADIDPRDHAGFRALLSGARLRLTGRRRALGRDAAPLPNLIRLRALWHSPTGGASMNKDRIEGAAHDTIGAVKSTAGRVAGDASTQAHGLYEQAAGTAQNAFGQARDAANQGARKVAGAVNDAIDQAWDAASGDNISRAASNAYGQARNVASQGAGAVAGQVKASPLTSILTVGGVAFLLGWLMRGRN